MAVHMPVTKAVLGLEAVIIQRRKAMIEKS